ncbi:MAG: TonB-dependent receptor plug domain-containing protein [Gammaproteobacteria bacterium]|nr:TonB-dependent receptor plug domain-containing protein [Gammaproteobacteria bacterium]
MQMYKRDTNHEARTGMTDAGQGRGVFRRAVATVTKVAFAITGVGAELAAGEEGDAEARIEVIIVTAEKREEDILDVPLTLSAFNDQAIEEFGMTADEDLENLVPGLQFGYDYEGQGVSMRGIGTHSAVINQADTSVAFYVDGVYSYKHYGIAPNMFDLARIEVARGPQGTLNGRNSIAGAVSYVTQRPTDTWDVNMLAEFTDQVTQRYGLAVGGPITDNWSFRLTGSYYGGDGAQENVGTGGDYDQPDQRMFSPQIRFTTDRLDANLRYSDLTDEGTSRAWVRMSDRPRDVASFVFFGFWEVPNPFYLYDKAIPSIANCDTGYFPSSGRAGRSTACARISRTRS